MALTITSLCSLMATFNASSVNIANPILASKFGITMDVVQWITTIYLIILCAFTLLFGRLGDRFGAHRVYIPGLIVFIIGSLACGLSGGLGLLLVFRALQAVGAAMMIATSMGLVATIFPGNQRGMALGLNVLMVGVGNLSGPALGGLILSNLDWPFIFYLNLPVGAVSLVLALFKLRSPIPPQKTSKKTDVPGTVLLAAFITALIVCLSGNFKGSVWFAPAAVAFLVIFLRVERKQELPVFDYSLMKVKRFSYGNLIAFLSYASTMMVMFQLPFFLNAVWKISVGTAGLLLMVSAVSMGLAGPLSGVISDKIGPFSVMLPSICLLITGQATTLFLSENVSYPHFIACLALSGGGMGLLNTPNNSDIMSSVGREMSGYASGFVATNRNLAFCVGTAASAGLFPVLMDHLTEPLGYTAAYLTSFRAILCISITLSVCSLVLCIVLRTKRSRGDGSPAGGQA